MGGWDGATVWGLVGWFGVWWWRLGLVWLRFLSLKAGGAESGEGGGVVLDHWTLVGTPVFRGIIPGPLDPSFFARRTHLLQ